MEISVELLNEIREGIAYAIYDEGGLDGLVGEYLLKQIDSIMESGPTPLALDAAGSGNDDEQERAAA